MFLGPFVFNCTSNLKQLMLSENRLTTLTPAMFVSPSKIDVLDLRNNQISAIADGTLALWCAILQPFATLPLVCCTATFPSSFSLLKGTHIADCHVTLSHTEISPIWER